MRNGSVAEREPRAVVSARADDHAEAARERGPVRRLPWAFVAANLLVLHLAGLGGPALLALAAVLLVPLDAVWFALRRHDPDRASRLALWMWAGACLLGSIGLFASRVEAAPVLWIALYGAAVFCVVALPEVGRPRSGAGRRLLVGVGLLMAVAVHMALASPGHV